MSGIWRVTPVGVMLACFAAGVSASEPAWEKVAEGQYRTVTEEETSESKWVLWATPDGFVVKGERTEVDAEEEEERLMRETLYLDKEFRLMRWEVSAPLSEERTITCGAAENELVCDFGGMREALRINAPYSLLEAGAWSFTALARQADRNAGSSISVRVVMFGHVRPAGGGHHMRLYNVVAEVTYLGQENFLLAGAAVPANRFGITLRGPQDEEDITFSAVWWTSSEGIVLAVEYYDGAESSRTDLVGYKKYAEFGVGK